MTKTHNKNTINTETSAGAIIYTKNTTNTENADGIKFLLLFSARNKEWGFAKGHIDDGETYRQTAQREIFEETGLADIKFIKGFEETDSYKIHGTLAETTGRIITKKVIYYLCYTDKQSFACKDNEISDYRLASLEEALKMLPFEQQKNILIKAYKFITEAKK